MKRFFIVASLILASFSFIFSPTANAKELTILAAFGTSDSEAQKSLDAIKKAYEAKGDDVIFSFSSNIIRAKLNKEKHVVYSITEALDYAHKKGYKDINIQSLHVVPAEEYMKICRLISRDMEKYPNRFNSVIMGHPLLSSYDDLERTIDAVMSSLPKERAKTDAVILMGHGNDRGTGDLSLIATANAFHQKDSLTWLATVEGALAFDNVLAELKKEKAVKKVWLLPFMIVAGDHAKNDMAGTEEDSWASMLKKEGYEVHTIIEGLGHNPKIQQIFLDHTKNSHDDILTGSIIKK